ncbi:galactose oxidase [Paenibacillus sp. BAC0078]
MSKHIFNASLQSLLLDLSNGTEKEYDLAIAEVNTFLTWYDARDAGGGPGMYAIDKHTNNKGPFSKRKEDYVVFDKILTFEMF